MARVRVLCIHGVGQHPPGGSWEKGWEEPIRTGLASFDEALAVEIEFLHYDEVFASHPLGFLETAEAIGKLVASGISAPFRSARGIGSALRWSAGMVVQWVENDALRRQTRARLAKMLEIYDADVVCAHSLGSLVAYDTFTHPDTKALVEGRVFVSLGSQIGNPFVTGQFLGGRITPLESARAWFHLFNVHDDVFTAQIRLSAPGFQQVLTPFDEPGIADHSAPRYLGHERTLEHVWSSIVLSRTQPRLVKRPKSMPAKSWSAKPARRALLVGINDYPQEAMRLEGCVNDAFLMSSLLQEAGFEPEDIRVVLDGRATAEAIRERLTWLLDGARKDDVRVLYYSGHGAQLPAYGIGDQVDSLDECLVPHDFAWTHESGITDDWFHDLYCQLPYETNFVAILDCCHSGGMTRQGGAKVRGLTPPDDIRHRALRWDAEHQMWRGREIQAEDEGFLKAQSQAPGRAATKRLGYAMSLRGAAWSRQKRLRKSREHHGPYMPLLLYACGEDQLAYEYKHGNASYGAFTFSLAKQLRSRTRTLSFEALRAAVAEELLALDYDQEPVLAGPEPWREAAIPFAAQRPRRATKTRRPRR